MTSKAKSVVLLGCWRSDFRLSVLNPEPSLPPHPSGLVKGEPAPPSKNLQ